MAYKRTDRVNALLRQELQQLVQGQMTDPRVGFATVTAVEVTPDLRHARVFVSVLAGEAEAQTALQALQDARAYLRHQLAGRTDLRYLPELSFRLDTSMEHASRIDALLREARADGAAGPDQDREEQP